MSSRRYQLSPQIDEFYARFRDELGRAVRNRMLRIGVPSAMIGIRFWGVEEGALVRYYPPQLGGNIRIGLNGQPGINVDVAALDALAPKVHELPHWQTASWKDRVDAVIAHEYTEVLAPPKFDGHLYAVENAEHTALAVTDTARRILREYREAEGL